jgi:hypothetical protein
MISILRLTSYFIFFFLEGIPVFPSIIVDNAFTKEARGTTAFSVLKSPVGVKFFSLGQSGISEYANESVFYNPAGAITPNSNSFYIDFQKEVSDSMRSDFSYLKRTEYKTYAFSLSYIDYGDFLKVNSNGGISGYFSPNDIIFGFTYSSGKDDRFGLNLKYIYSDMVYYSKSSLSMDAGFILKGNRTRYSFLVRNLGIPVEIDGRTYPLPLEIIVGAKYFYSKNLSGTFEVKMPSDDSPYACGGFEYIKKYRDMEIALRGGMNLKNKTPLGWGSVFSGGFGIKLGNFDFDYSFVPYSDIDATHKFAIKFRYGDVDFKKIEKRNFEDFVAKQISMKKRIVVFDFNSDLDEDYSKIVANAVEERLIEKNYSLISRLDPDYILKIKNNITAINEAISKAKELGADYAVWGDIKKLADEKANFNFFLIDARDSNVSEFSFLSAIYDIGNISLKISNDISQKI